LAVARGSDSETSDIDFWFPGKRPLKLDLIGFKHDWKTAFIAKPMSSPKRVAPTDPPARLGEARPYEH
jgi:hypothetical protein